MKLSAQEPLDTIFTKTDVFAVHIKEFRLIEKHELGVNSTDMSIKILPGEVIKFERAEQSCNLIYVYPNISKEENQKFRVSYYDNEKIILVYRDKKHIYNLVFST